jgi:hypothetical protein
VLEPTNTIVSMKAHFPACDDSWTGGLAVSRCREMRFWCSFTAALPSSSLCDASFHFGPSLNRGTCPTAS